MNLEFACLFRKCQALGVAWKIVIMGCFGDCCWCSLSSGLVCWPYRLLFACEYSGKALQVVERRTAVLPALMPRQGWIGLGALWLAERVVDFGKVDFLKAFPIVVDGQMFSTVGDFSYELVNRHDKRWKDLMTITKHKVNLQSTENTRRGNTRP